MNGLIIDNFAGGGGASTGIEMALGRSPDIAINHDPKALAMHRANHPDTIHLSEDVWAVDPKEVTKGRPVDLCWFSPDCKHFSKAKGKKPVSKKIRGLAWVALRWAAIAQPRLIFLENVEEFQDWGPLDSQGKPIPAKKGATFRSFVRQLREKGYTVDWRVLSACAYGAPTIRKRLFMIARKDSQPIIWPEPTHGEGLLPYHTAADCIDWSIPCPSIFTRTKPLAEATCRRIAKGIVRYVLNAERPYIAPTGAIVLTECANASSPRCMDPNEPLRTICAETKGGHHALVTAFLAKHYGGVIGHKLEQPLGTITSVDHHSLVTAHVIRHFGQSVGSGPTKPLGTITAGGMGKAGLVLSHLCKMRGTNIGGPIDQPLHTISAQGTHHAEVRTFLQNFAAFGGDATFPLVRVNGELFVIVDIGLRMLQPRELYDAQGFPSDYIIEEGVCEFGKRVKLTKTDQVRMCGNSVSPVNAAALISANAKDLRVSRETPAKAEFTA